MSKELIVSYHNGVAKMAILNDGLLEELHEESDEKKICVGDIYLAKIKKLKPELNSCFVDFGEGKDGFLHYHDLGRQLKSTLKYISLVFKGKIKSPKLDSFSFEKDIDKNGQIGDIFKPKDTILVQIAKEPISTKGARLTSEISLAGRYMVLVPFSNMISISKNISDNQERERLKTLTESIVPKGMGVIIRTVAEGKKVADLHSDLNFLLNKWNQCYKNIQKARVPFKVLSELDKAQSILRDNFNEEYTSIVSDDEELTEDLKNYIEVIAPEKKDIVKFYDSHVPIFENFAIERKIKQAFGKYVNIPNSKGAYLVIEHTEALHVVDVNSGTIKAKDKTQEESALKVNLLAAKEIARQLKLRDIGGIIVIDFIDMTNPENRRNLFDSLRQEMSSDKAKHKILPPSKFGLVQITRQRVRPQKEVSTFEEEPNNGKVEAPILTIERIENEINQIVTRYKGKIYLHVHPFIASYLKIGFPSVRIKWFYKYKRLVTIVERDAYKYLEFSFFNDKNEPIKKVITNNNE
ncbi:MAG: Rne/Rng family ribonuclease [Flavobacteriales bacterium]|nr:Rne/Rng family ribonuclease [Flavobacteriales bacterium]